MQLTRAMKMVSAAKLRRSQDRMLAARPYAGRMASVLRSLAARANPEAHPLLQVRGDRRIELLVITADRGLCGSFNANVIKKTMAFVADNKDKEISLLPVGRKGRDFFRRRTIPIRREWLDVSRDVNYPLAATIARELIDRYDRAELDSIRLVYNEFKSLSSQKPVIEQLLPIERMEPEAGSTAQDYIYEPEPRALFDSLLPRHVEMQVYRALLESAAAEQAARMAAMSSATKNAGELIDRLTLYMNRVRQAGITTEIIEVVSGAQALG